MNSTTSGTPGQDEVFSPRTEHLLNALTVLLCALILLLPHIIIANAEAPTSAPTSTVMTHQASGSGGTLYMSGAGGALGD